MKSPLYHYKEFKPEEEEQEGNRLGRYDAHYDFKMQFIRMSIQPPKG